jgi:formylglycine-generating enzyme required for sulfatase activity
MPVRLCRLACAVIACAAAAAWLPGVSPAGDKPKLPQAPRFPFGEEPAKAFQDDYAKAAGVPKEVANSVGMKLVLIPPGSFEMGPNGSKYRVALSKPFYGGVNEVTLGQYRKFKPGHTVEGADDEFNEDDRPAAMVSWDDAKAFCAWLSAQDEEKKAGRVYALPTEAQWEWAARAGTTTARYFGETDKEQAKFSWFNVTYTPNPKAETKGRGRQPVAKLPANAWGLYDTLGNVWEWCADRHTDAATGETRDPVMRGGSWRSGAFHCTAVAHDPGAPGTKGDNNGFRVVVTVAVGK